MKPPLTRYYYIAAVEQFEYQTTNRLLIASLEKYEDSGATQKEKVKKTTAKMLWSIHIFVVNDYNKQIWNVKVENERLNISP